MTMDETVVQIEQLKLKPNRKLLSPPWLGEPLYQCATAVTVWGFVAHATLDVELDGAVVVTVVAGFPEPIGARVKLPAPLIAGQKVRVRQHSDGLTSDWSPVAEVRDHTVDYPAGPPRPQVNPAPVFTCGSRTGVGNLLGGANVWITADGTEVGRVNGCGAPQQGVNVNPFYSLGQKVRAHTELCKDEAPPSIEYTAGPGPNPLPTPGFDPIYAGGEQIRITSIANGARVHVTRDGMPMGTYRCWGGALLLGLTPVFGTGETFTATQELCPGDPPSGTGTGVVLPCSALPAPTAGPVQAGDTPITITSCAPGATIRVFRNFVQVGFGSAPVVQLAATLAAGDVVHVTQSLPGCSGQLALQLTVACIDPPVSGDPSALDLFPVGHTEYADGPVKGSVYYPGDDDGQDQPFNTRLATLGRAPIVVMAHRLGLMGHSRGGDAVVTIPTLIGSIGVTIRAVLALAPTNFRYWAGMSTLAPNGYAFSTILPAADSDVVDNNGAQLRWSASEFRWVARLCDARLGPCGAVLEIRSRVSLFVIAAGHGGLAGGRIRG
jgi:hypothetical protein